MKSFFNILNRLGLWTAGLALFLMMLLTAVDVFGRYVLGNAITGTNDMTELLMAVIVFLALSYTASSGGHISVEVVTAQLSTKKQYLLKSVTSALSGIVMAVVTWRMVKNAVDVFQQNERTMVLYIQKGPFVCIAAIGCGMLTLALILIFYEAVSGLLKSSDDKGIRA